MAPNGGQKSRMIPLLALLLAASPDPSPDAQPLIGSPPQAPSSVAALLSNDDYPAEALRNNWQGTVQVKLRIGTDGRVRACRIVRSSGHDSLDLATCRIMLMRARFSPARDSNGNAVEDDFVSPPISWRLEEEETKPELLPSKQP